VESCARTRSNGLYFFSRDVLKRVDQFGDLFAPVLSMMQPHRENKNRRIGDKLSARALSEYNKKRDFKKSTGATRQSRPQRKTLYYCIQKHLASHLHYDLRRSTTAGIAFVGCSKSARLSTQTQSASQFRWKDHPRDYGSSRELFQAAMARGIVLLWDRGTWTPHGDVAAMIEKGHLSFELHGQKLAGAFALRACVFESAKPQWLLVRRRPRPPRPKMC